MSGLSDKLEAFFKDIKLTPRTINTLIREGWTAESLLYLQSLDEVDTSFRKNLKKSVQLNSAEVASIWGAISKKQDHSNNPTKKQRSDLLHLFGLLSTVPPLFLPPISPPKQSSNIETLSMKRNSSNPKQSSSGKMPSSVSSYIRPSGKTSSSSTKVKITTELKKWPDFGEDFEHFQNQIKVISEKENECIYNPIDFPRMEVIADSQDDTRQLHSMWLNLAFWTQIYKDHRFKPAPNDGEKIKSDIYWKNENDPHSNDFFAEVKSVNALEFPEDASELIANYYQNTTTNAVRIHDAITQVVNYTNLLIKKKISNEKERCSYSILTNHNVMYCFKLIVKEDEITRKKTAYLFVSNPVKRDKQYLAVFFILLLRYPSLTPKGFDDVKTLLDKIDKKFKIDESSVEEQHPSVGTSSVSNQPPIGPMSRSHAAQIEKDQDHSEQISSLTLEEEIYYHWIDDAVVFVWNSNYVLAKYVGSNHEEFVIKCCDKFNSSKQALDEIRNEIYVLDKIKKKLVSKPYLQQFFPQTIYLGTIAIWKMIVSKYINGKCYDEFDEMPEKVKMACVASIRELHKLGIQHGDIRAPNFIIEKPDSEDPVAIVIDFGRSRLGAKKADLKEEFDQFRRDLYAENPDSSKCT